MKKKRTFHFRENWRNCLTTSCETKVGEKSAFDAGHPVCVNAMVGAAQHATSVETI